MFKYIALLASMLVATQAVELGTSVAVHGAKDVMKGLKSGFHSASSHTRGGFTTRQERRAARRSNRFARRNARRRLRQQRRAGRAGVHSGSHY